MPLEPGSPHELDTAVASLGLSGTDDIPEIAVSGAESAMPNERTAVTHVLPGLQVAKELLQGFRDFLNTAKIELGPSTVTDLLAAYLSSQFLLFAGPSGTGKSTVARALLHFFTEPDAGEVIEARRQLIGPEDVAGYLSPISGAYVRTPELGALLRIGAPGAGSTPGLLVEEINLSPVEGYLAPFVHGLSGITNDSVVWSLHSGDPSSATSVPRRIEFKPYPRLLGSINVDSTALAPSPKVAARACVVLLEPPEELDLSKTLAGLTAQAAALDPHAGSGARLVGNPLEIFDVPEVDQDELVQHLTAVINELRGFGQQGEPASANPVTRRQAGQMLLYGAWFVLVAKAHEGLGGSLEADAARLGVENAVLHYVLPTLPGAEFGLVLDRLTNATNLADQGSGANAVGALLKARVNRLGSIGGDSLLAGRVLDFWDRLS